MNVKIIMIAALVCAACMALLLISSEPAWAQSADQKTAMREGLGNKEIDESKLPGKLEIGLAIGSIIAMIGVLKFV